MGKTNEVIDLLLHLKPAASSSANRYVTLAAGAALARRRLNRQLAKYFLLLPLPAKTAFWLRASLVGATSTA
jgi:hypothetical protein